MAFKHKLSRRLALLRDIVGVLVPVAVSVTCQAPSATGTDPQLTQIVVVPDSVTLGPSQQRRFAAYGRWPGGETSSVMVAWSATGGTITSAGLFTADTTSGDFQITAAAAQWGLTGRSKVHIHPHSVMYVAVAPNTAGLRMGQTLQLTATAEDSSGAAVGSPSFTWTTNAPAVATVSSTGLVTAMGLGAATVGATTGSVSGSASLTVSAVSVSSVTVTPSAGNLFVGRTLQLAATPTDSAGNPLSGLVVTWTTSASGIATVSATGLVTAVAPGTATIAATSGGKSGTALITTSVVPVASVTLSPGLATVTVGQTLQLTATPKDSAGNPLTGRVVSWTTSAGGVATVSASGLVTGVAAGTATITATSEGKSGAATVTVTVVPVASVTVSPASGSLYVGQSLQFTATPKDSAGNPLTGRVVTWATSASGVARVSPSGLVSGVAAGTATITATSGGKSGSAAVTVTFVPVASVGVSPASGSLHAGQTLQLTATPKDSAGNPLSGQVITWGTSASGVATVSAGGLVTAVAPGTATITATAGGKSATAVITVTVVPVASVVVSPSAAAVLVGQTVQLTATPEDSSGNPLTGWPVTWSTSAAGVATVSTGGLVAGVVAGSVTITATAGGKSGAATVTVTVTAGGVAGNIYDASLSVSSALTDGIYNGGGGSSTLATQGFVLDATTSPGAPWAASIRADIAPSGGQNTGAAMYYGTSAPDLLVGPTATFDANPVTKLYVRFAYRQSNPFNYNGTTSNANTAKFVRPYPPGANGAAAASVVINGGSGDFVVFYDHYDTSDLWYANCNTSNRLTNANNTLGQWHWYEYYVDVSDDAHHVIVKLWIDGILVHYHDVAYLDGTCGPSTTPNPNFSPGSGTYPLGEVEITGTINSMASQSSFWNSQVGISTQPMGVPTRSYP